MTAVTAVTAELVVDAKPPPGDASDGSGTSIGRVAVPIGAAALLAKFSSPAAGGVALAAAVAFLLLTRKPKEGRTLLRAVDGELEVRREGEPEPRAQLRIDEILDVTIDREPRKAETQQQKERVRLALERRAGDPLYIPESRITPLEAQEWYGRVRVFLRAQGWLPKDERKEPVDQADAPH